MRNRNGKSASPEKTRQACHSILGALVALGCAMASSVAHSQTVVPKVDLAVSFVADLTNPVGGSNSWLTGGGIELGIDAWRGLGIAANVTGAQASSISAMGVGLGLVTATFGPRYRYTWRNTSGKRTISAYGEALLGEANAFNSVFPTKLATTDSASTFAEQFGGGIDLGLSRRFAVRVVQADWLRTQFPNTTTNVQNHLQLGAGLVLKF